MFSIQNFIMPTKEGNMILTSCVCMVCYSDHTVSIADCLYYRETDIIQCIIARHK